MLQLVGVVVIALDARLLPRTHLNALGQPIGHNRDHSELLCIFNLLSYRMAEREGFEPIALA
jgi:hypothetical protein